MGKIYTTKTMRNHVFDIETKALPDKVTEFTKPFAKEEVLVGNLKDPEKIAAKQEAAEAGYWAKAHDKAALNPHTSEIVTIGIHLDNNGETFMLEGSEAHILGSFWTIYKQHTQHNWCYWTGSNDKGAFDVRHIVIRSWVNRVPVPEGLVSARGYLSNGFVDLAQVFLFGAPFPSYCSLDLAGRQLGVIGTTNDCATVQSKLDIEATTGVTGMTFAEFRQGEERQHEQAVAYLRNDLALTRGIADIIL